MQEELIIKYIQNDLGPDARDKVQEWIAQSEENEKRFHELRDTWVAALYSSEASGFNTDKAWETFISKVKSQKKQQKMVIALKWVSASAAAVAVFALGLFGLMNNSPEYHTHSFADNENLELPDGSSVTLNEESSIKYPEKFLASQREITIFGEAFFEVAPDSEKPFVVKAGDYRVKVLGTKFNVKKVRSDIYEVYVTEGKVAVFLKEMENDAMILLPGDLAVLGENNENKLAHAGNNYLSWKTDELVFENTSLEEVLDVLGKHYNKKLIADESIKKQKLTTRFKDKTLSEALHTIEIVFDASVEYEDNYIVVSANSPPDNEKQKE